MKPLQETNDNIFYYCEKVIYKTKMKFTKAYNKNVQVLLKEYRKKRYYPKLNNISKYAL